MDTLERRAKVESEAEEIDEEQTEQMSPHDHEVTPPSGRLEGMVPLLVWALIFLAMLAYGLYLGNVFETHHNGANL